MGSPIIRTAASLLLVLALSCGAASCAGKPAAPPAPAAPSSPADTQPGAPATPPGEQPLPPADALQVNMRQIARIDLPDGADLAGDEPLSPDGQWVIVRTHRVGHDDELIAYPSAGGPGVTVATAPASLVDKGALYLYPTGWAGDTRLAFILQGVQADGPHKDSKGVSLRVVDLGGEADAAEVAWIPAEGDDAIQVFQASRQVFVFVGATLWKAALENPGRQASLTRIGLPGPEAAFEPLISPNGTHYAFFDRKNPWSGIHLFDTQAAGSQAVKPVELPSTEIGYRPVWSPDGRHIAFYGARALQNGGGGNATRYGIVLGDDGPSPVGDFVGIADLDGNVVTRLEVEGSRIAGFEWSDDSSSIAFSTIDRDSYIWPDPSTWEWQSVWAGNISGTRKVCDLPAGSSGWVALDPSGLWPDSLYFTLRQRATDSLWFVKQGGQPVEVKKPSGGGLWMATPARHLRDSAVMMIEGQHRLVVRVQGDKVTETLVDRGQTMTSNVAANRLACWVRDPGTGKRELLVYGLE